MLLTISTTHRPASDLGFLLHKHPGRTQSTELAFGAAHVFYPEVSDERCTACLLLEVDAVGLARGGESSSNFSLAPYVNDRPYVASSFLSVAIAQLFGSAMNGRSKDRPDLATRPIPLEARLDALPVRGGEAFLRSVFEPLGYAVEASRLPLDDKYPEWGESAYFSVTLRAEVTLAALLTHLYVLIPVFDARKHYFVSTDEMEKRLAKGGDWLPAHPLREEIARRYLKNRPGLWREALARLVPEADDEPEENPERQPGLHAQRLDAVLAALKASGATSVIDLGCGEGKLIRRLIAEKRFTRVVGVDVSSRSLEIASRALKLDRLPEGRVSLLHGSLLYRDKRFAGFDAAAVVEVVEHLDPPRLAAFEAVVFKAARPRTVVLTTPNREYNAVWESLPEGKLRHGDHRFEWTRQELRTWAEAVAARHGYRVELSGVGPEHEAFGAPSQMAVFTNGAE